MTNTDIEISFWTLISKEIEVEIPIIQRDYVQGREDTETNRIRKLFLNNLTKALEDPHGSLELDFIYGDLKAKVFQPLDGQQRLTTLFLLHWYIAYTTENLSDDVKKHLSRFTYETRVSSREFCEQLVKEGDNLGEGNKISTKISDSAWFFLSWQKDPTIKAMLVMLDNIEEKLEGKDKKIFWQRLTSQKSPITFHFIKLKDIGLTDDVYIKMNARGKALTDFENFKARFEKYIGENKWEKNAKITNTFSHRIDTIWTDLFWKYRYQNLIDEQFMKFFTAISLNHYAEESKTGSIQTLYNNPNDINPEDFPSQTSFEYLKKCLDIYADKKTKYDELSVSLTFWTYEKRSLFTQIVDSPSVPYRKRVLFYAQTQYLLSVKPFENESFTEWMRVVRNIVQNISVDSPATFSGAISLIRELSAGCSKIYEYLAEPQLKLESRFASEQVEEEKLKASLIIKSDSNKAAVFNMEDTNFFKGNIRFAFYCIGFENTDDAFDSEDLNSLYKVVCEHLNRTAISNEFRRALLTIKDNRFYDYWQGFSYTTDCHRRRLIQDTRELRTYFTASRKPYRDYLKDLLLKLVEKSLAQIIDEYKRPGNMPNWKFRLIKEPRLLDDHCQSHYFGIPYYHPYNNKEFCLLFNDFKRPREPRQCEKVE